MSDKSPQDDGDLFDTEDSDTGADTESTTDEQSSDSLDEEITEDSLDLEETESDKGTSSAKREQDKQFEVWYSRLVSGEAKIENLPQSVKWLKPRLLDRLNADNQAPEIDKLIEQKFAAKEDERDYKILKSTLGKQRLTASQKESLKAEFTDLRGVGLSKSKALEKAMRIVGIAEQEDTTSNQLRNNMRTVSPAGKVKELSFDKVLDNPSTYLNASEEDRLKMLEEAKNHR